MNKEGSWKPKKKRWLRQGLGIVLSAAMVMGLSGGSILTAYAAEDEGGTDTELSDGYEVTLDQDEDGYYLIFDEEELLSYAEMVENGYADSNARLAGDFTVAADSGFAGIGTSDTPYAGTFDGDGHTVTLSMSTDGAAGLFAFVSGAAIEDVVTAGTVTTTVNKYGCAGLVSYVMGDGVTITGCVNKADVSGAVGVGGLVGRSAGSSSSTVSVTLTDSSNEGSVTATGYYVGGIAGVIYGGSISDCTNSGVITGGNYGIGGIVGYDYNADISGCLNEGSVISTSTSTIAGYVGGIVGYAYAHTGSSISIQQCFNEGSVSGNVQVGGVAGMLYCYGDSGISLSECGNDGSITGTGNYVGGLAGYGYIQSSSSGGSMTLTGLYNTGMVSGAAYVGGIVGSQPVRTGFSNAYNTGAVSGTAVSTGGLLGYTSGSGALLSDSYNAGAVSYTTSGVQHTGGMLVGAMADYLNYMYVENAYYLSSLGGTPTTAGTDYFYSNSTQEALTEDEAAAMAKTSLELENLASALGDAFQDNWVETYHNGYPILSWEDNGDDPETVRYGVSFDFSGISTDGRTKAVAGTDYTATLTADEYYLLPESITVTAGGTELVSGESYTYDAESGALTVYAVSITGDIEITAVGIAPYNVSTSLTNISSDGASKATVGTDYTATLTADEYYALPESITVTSGGTELVSGEGYTYDAESGVLTVYAASVTGDIEITAVGIAPYSVSTSLTNISSDGASIVVVGTDYTATLTADEYYLLPESITVTAGGTELVSGEGYTYDAESGALMIYAASVTGDIEITAVGIAPYNVSTSLTNISSDGASKATVGADYTATLTADEYYALPESITVTAGGTELVSGEGYTYDAESGALTVYAASVTGDIVITATGVATSYSVSTSLSNLSSDGDARVAVGTDYTATLTVANQYFTLPDSITVTVDGTELVSGEGYTYDAENGTLTVYAASVIGDISITAAGVLSITTDLTQDEDGYYLLYTESDILDFASLVENASAELDARLMADITVSADSGFAGIGTSSAPYAGTFDGNGYTVTLSLSTDGAAGLFAYVSGATIKDVTTAGTVASSVNTYGCAGLVSYVMDDGVTITGCVNQADVSGAGYVAGLVGRCSSRSVTVTVSDSSNEGNITCTGSGIYYAGGIAGLIYNGSITGCVNYGMVSGTSFTGGIIGYAYSYGNLEILNCGNNGDVVGTGTSRYGYYTGGIVGRANVSSSASLVMDGLYNTGSVSGSSSYVGGIVGQTYTSLSNAYNTGTVSGTAVSTGGLVGNNYLSGTVLSNTYNAGAVTYTSSDVTYAGGLLVGSITSSSYVMYVDNSYYLSTLDGSAIASGSDYLYSNSTQAALTSDKLAAMAKTSEELAALADTLGDSFAANTDADYHLGYPILAWEVEEDETEELRIISHPADYTGTAGSTAVFEVEAAGSSLTYQWQYLNAGAVNWKDSGMDGADTAALTVSITEARDGQQYRCVVTDGEGNTVTSDAAALTVTTEAGFSITLQPSDYTGLIGTMAVFTVEADGTGLTYQWQYQNADGTMWHDSGMTGADTAELSVPVTEARDGQQYRCIVTDENGNSVISDAAALRLPSAGSIVITAQPADVSGSAGDTAVFTVEATGNGLTYQWQYLNAGAVNWKDSGMSGADTAALSVPVTEARDGQQYRCVITDEDGNMLVSDIVTMSVE